MTDTDTDNSARPAEAYNPDAVKIRHSPGMAEWLLKNSLSLAYTSYATGRLIVVGVAPDGRLFFNEQNYRRAMGIHYQDRQLHVASQHQIWRLSEMLAPGEYANAAFDCVLVPRVAHTTGYLDVHELSIDRNARPIFVNTKYSCLATTDPDYSFRPLWKPPFISELVPDDRCHLNGLAMVDGVPKYVTAFDVTDSKSGWREGSRDQGVVIDVVSGEIVATDLFMPHSPRVHDGALWVLESGRGFLVRIDISSGRKTDVAFCPGFVRGLSFHNGYAIVAASKARENSQGLPLHDELKKHDAQPWCALLIVDLNLGLISNFIRYDTEITELFDVAVLPDIRNPMTLGPSTEELLHTLRFNPQFAALVE